VKNEDVLETVERIVSSEHFLGSARLQSFLRFIVNQTVAEKSKNIKAYTIATEAFGRDASFDAGADPIVRVQGGRLRKSLDLYNAIEGADDPIRITIPKGSYVPKIERRSKAEQLSITPQGSSCGLGTPLERPVIAIFPCEPIYSAPWQAGFCEVMAEEILDALSKFQTVDVLPVASSMNAMQTTMDPRECGKLVRADFILEGRFCSDSEASRLMIKLISVETGTFVWSKAYDLDLKPSNKLAVQRSTAAAISSEVAQPFGYVHRDVTWASGRRDINDLNAYECVLQSHLYHAEANQESFDRALTAAKRAVELLPDCGTASANLAELYCEGYRIGRWGVEATLDYLDAAFKSAKTAYQLCSECSVSSMAMADVYFATGEFDQGIEMGRTALVQNPNDHALKIRFGACLAYASEWLLSITRLEEALQHQPASLAQFSHLLTDGKRLAEKYQQSSDALENAASLIPPFEEAGKVVNYIDIGRDKAVEKVLSRMSGHRTDATSTSLDLLYSRASQAGVAG